MRSHQDLLEHLQAVTGLEEATVAKIVEELHTWYGQDLAAWLRSRHQELQRRGLRNREIFPRLREEAAHILVRPSALTERQIRRIIYG
jgi:hypothetical protein